LDRSAGFARLVTPHRLRRLTLDPGDHPEGRQHISAASGLVCAHGRAWVIADDEQHLASFAHPTAPGTLHRVLPGNLPAKKSRRKKRKADFETLLWHSNSRSLVALGSGSAQGRDRGVVVSVTGTFSPRVVNLAPLYEPLRDELGSINIEGAFYCRNQVLLLNRGHAKGIANALVRYTRSDFDGLLKGKQERVLPKAVQTLDLGTIDGAVWGFTDGCALPDGGFLFSAAAEASDNSVADGTVLGSALGQVDAQGRLQSLHPLHVPHKVEGIDVQRHRHRLWVFMVTDADDAAEASWLLSAQWGGRLTEPDGIHSR
jgi:hypothetical protein